jgi:hypothetical protein
MGPLGTTVFEARIALWNLDDADVGAGEPIVATVQTDPLEGAEDCLPQPIVYLVPLVAVSVLRNSQSAPETTAPLMDILDVATGEMLASESRARELRLRQLIHPGPTWSAFDGEIDAAAVMRLGVPELDAPAAGSPFKLMRARLIVGHRGTVFASIRGVGNSFQAAFGLFALVEHTARTQDYSDVVNRVGTALAEIAWVYTTELDERAPTAAQAGGLADLVCLRLANDNRPR